MSELIKQMKKKVPFVLIGIVIVISLLIRHANILVESRDYTTYLVNWCNILKENGGIFALNQEIGDYNVPYIIILALLTYLPINYLISIKVVSILFDYLLAISMFFLVRECFGENKNKNDYGIIAFMLTLILPTVFINSSWWGQCDSIYATFIILSLLFLIKEKYFRAFILLGLSFAFKLQFIFILPVYIAIYLTKRKFPFYYFFIIPIVNFIMCLPAIFEGRGIINCLKIYFSQTGNYNQYISLNFPGIYNLLLKVPANSHIIDNPNVVLSKIMLVITIFIFASMFVYIILGKVNFDKKMIIEFSIWSILTATFFLPYMHERYMYVAEVLSIIYFLINRKKIFTSINNYRIKFSMYICVLFTFRK